MKREIILGDHFRLHTDASILGWGVSGATVYVAEHSAVGCSVGLVLDDRQQIHLYDKGRTSPSARPLQNSVPSCVGKSIHRFHWNSHRVRVSLLLLILFKIAFPHALANQYIVFIAILIGCGYIP